MNVIDIQKTGKGSATVTVNGRAYPCRFDTASRRWIVTVDGAVRTTTSPKLKSVAALFGPQVSVSGASPKRPRSSGPRAPRQSRAPKPPKGQAFATAKPTVETLKLAAVAALEDLFVVKLRDRGVTPEARKAYDTYKKCLTRALAPSSSQLDQNEADTALRMAVIQLVKVAL